MVKIKNFGTNRSDRRMQTEVYMFTIPSALLYFQTTVQILCIGTDRSQQTVQTKIRLLLKKQSDQGLRCLPSTQHLLNFSIFRTIMAIVEVSQILEFLR